MDEVPNNFATKGFAAGEASQRMGRTLIPSQDDLNLGYPKPFDIEDGTTEGNIKLVRCYFQIGAAFYQANDIDEITPSAGNLCAVINTNDGTVTAAIDAAFNPATPELFPMRLYVLDADGNVTCDCRGSQVVVYA
jgi:hypothetical protein